jgi:hypothetical protein
MLRGPEDGDPQGRQGDGADALARPAERVRPVAGEGDVVLVAGVVQQDQEAPAGPGPDAFGEMVWGSAEFCGTRGSLGAPASVSGPCCERR